MRKGRREGGWCIREREICKVEEDRQTDRQTDRQADRQTDRQTDKQTD